MSTHTKGSKFQHYVMMLGMLLVWALLILLEACGSDEVGHSFSATVSVSAPDATGKEGDNDAAFMISLSTKNTSGSSRPWTKNNVLVLRKV